MTDEETCTSYLALQDNQDVWPPGNPDVWEEHAWEWTISSFVVYHSYLPDPLYYIGSAWTEAENYNGEYAEVYVYLASPGAFVSIWRGDGCIFYTTDGPLWTFGEWTAWNGSAQCAYGIGQGGQLRFTPLGA